MITLKELKEQTACVAVVGLGYVGLPLAVALARHFQVIGFDVAASRIQELRNGLDHTGEVEAKDLQASNIRFVTDPVTLKDAAVIIVAVPTPIDAYRNPDLTPVRSASAVVGKHMAAHSVVVYESTVFPGVTEDICVPILEAESGLTYGSDFTVGYSPERINPGDKVHTVDKIVKVVSGSDALTCNLLADVYGTVVTAGIHKATSIKVAEAAKVIENTQRDLNIALMNELALIFDKLGIDTLEVLAAAGTKWNFLPFRPGLVGGHCIGVDPYYLTFKAEEVGYHPEVILAGRRINDGMGKVIAEKAVKMLIASGEKVASARVGILGLTFKENVPDLRNTRVVDIVAELKEYGINAQVCDPLASAEEAQKEYGIDLQPMENMQDFDAVIVAVNHAEFSQLSLQDMHQFFGSKEYKVLIDVKGLWHPHDAAQEGFVYWRL